MKNLSQTHKEYSKKIVTNIYLSIPFLRTLTIRMGSECSKDYFLDFYYYLSYTWTKLIYLTCLIFLLSPWLQVQTFCAQHLLKGTMLSSIICVIKCSAIFEELPSVAASVSDQEFSRPHLSSLKFLLWWSSSRKNLWWSIFFKFCVQKI